MKEAFIHYTFAGKSLQLVQQAIAILDVYVAEGYRLTLRQLYRIPFA